MAAVDRQGRAGRASAGIAHAMAVLALLLPPPLLAQSYPNPLNNTATVTAPTDVADPTPGNNSATDTNALALQAQLSVSKTLVSASPVAAGGPVQYRIQVNNAGPSAASGVGVVDTVSSLLTNVAWTCQPTTAASSCAQPSGSGNAVNVLVSVGVGDSVVLLVNGTAPAATPATVPANSVSLVLPSGTTDPTPGDNTATTPAVPVQANALVAANDSFTTPISSTSGGSTPTVLGNDTLNGQPVVGGNLIISLQNAPAGFTINSAGVIAVPAGAAAGSTSIGYQICENASPTNCATATASLVIAPTAVADSYNVNAGTPSLTGNLAANDNAPAGATYSQTGMPVAGATISSTGTLTYAPAGNITQPVQINYQVCLPAPNASVCSTSTASVVVGANVLVATDDTFATPLPPGAGGTTPSVLGNDTFDTVPVTPAQVTLSLVGAPSGFSINPNGTIVVPASAAAGPRALTYQMCDANAATNCATATANLVVSPDAVDDAVSTPGGGRPVTGTLAGNDNFASGSVFTLGTQATRGTAVVNADGTFTYTPANASTGPDTFTYQLCLPAPNATVCDTATVTVSVAANQLAAADDLFATPLQPGTTTAVSLLGNDTLNGTAVAPAGVSLALSGAPASITANAAGQLQVAAGAAAGAYAFTYQICELPGGTNCATANVQLVIAPDAVDDSFAATAGVALANTVAGNDNVPAGSQFSLLAGAAHGTVSVAADGGFSYTAQGTYSGADSFRYQVCLPAPNGGICDAATVTLNVAVAAVVAGNDDFTAAPVPGTGGTTASVLANDTLNGVAIDAAQATLSLINAPPAGFTLAPTGELQVPAGAPAGPLSLTYQLCQAGTSNCATATIAVVIAPQAVADSFSTQVGRAVSGNVSVNDRVAAGSTYAVTGTPPQGLVFNADGSFTYTPPAQYTGTTTFSYQACLAAPFNTVCSTATATLNVNAGTLVANDDDFRGSLLNPATGGTTISVLANDTINGAIPPAPAEVILSLLGAPSGYVLNPNGTISVPGGAAAGAVNFGYRLCEAALPTNCDDGAVQLLLAPVAVNDNVSTAVGVPVSGNVGSNDNVPAGATFSITGTAPAGLVLAAGGAFTYTPPAGTQGIVTFAYQACLPAPNGTVCAGATVTLNVNAGTLVAGDDDFRATPIGAGGGSTLSVLLNDSLNGTQPPASADVLLSLVGAPSGFTLDASGVLNVDAGVPSGALTLTYQLCETALPSNCDSAQIRLVVSPTAVADVFSTPAGQLLSGSVASNDNAPVGAVFTVSGTTPDGLQLGRDGTFQYTPPAGFTGPVSFSYQACLPAPDGALCSTAGATINVNAGTLMAMDDDFSATPLAPGATTSTSVLVNDSLNGGVPPPAGSVTLALVGAPSGYALTTAGLLQVPASAAAGATVLSYQICETAAPSNCASASIRLVVTPSAQNDSYSTAAGQPLNGSVGDNDNVPAGAVFTIVGATPAGLSFGGGGSFTYLPPVNAASPITFTYQVCLPAPNTALCATATASINITVGSLAANNDDFSSTPVNPVTGGSTPSVLLNDALNGSTPPAAADVLLSLAGAPAGISFNPDGTVSVAAGVPAGGRTLTYQLCEAAAPGNCATATLRLVVAPSAVDDALSTPAGVDLASSVAGNDNVGSGAQFSVVGTPPPGLQFNADGSFIFAPATGFSGAVTFSYQVCLAAPDSGACATATATLNVNSGTLVAVDDTITAPVAAGSATSSVLGNDTLNSATPAADEVVLSLVGAPSGFSIAADGTIAVATGTASGAVSLTYQVCEAAATTNCATANVALVVAPAPANDAFAVQAGLSVTANVASNDGMPVGSTFALQGTPPAGVTFNADGSFTYAPPAGTTSPTSFVYQACLPAPNSAVCATATATLNINNGALLANNDSFGAIAPGAATASVLANDTLNGISPPAPANVALTLVGAPAGFSISPTGTVSVPADAASGATTLTYQVCETAAANNCATASIALVVRPTPQNDTISVQAGQANTGNVAGNDAMPAGSTWNVPSPPQGLVFNANGSFTYTPPAGTLGPVTFSYQACLPAPDTAVCGTATATLTIAVSAIVATDDAFAAPLTAGSVTPSVLANDVLNGVTPPPSAAVQLLLVAPPAGFIINNDGSVQIPASAPAGATTLTYQLCETASPTNCATAAITFVVTPAPQADAFAVQAGASLTGASVATNDNLPAGSSWAVQGTPPAGLAFNADGSFSYTPPVGTTGAVTFTYQACLPAPNTAVCGTATATLNVNTGTLAAANDSFSGIAAGGTTASVLANDSLNGTTPPAPASVQLSLVGAPAGFAINPDGTLVVPTGVLSGATTLTYQICETAVPSNCDTATVALVITPSPQPDAYSVLAAGTISNGNVAANDNLPTGSQFSVQGTVPSGLSFNNDGSFTYTAPANTPSPVTFTYRACLPAPDAALCEDATVTLNINDGTLAAADDSFTVAPGGSTGTSVLANDALNNVSPPAAGTVLVSLVGAPAGFVLAADGVLTVPAGIVSGPLTLTYQACEAASAGNCDTASIALVILPAPQADVFGVQAGQVLSASVAGNDNMPAGSSWTVQGPTPAGLVFNSDGSFSYTPPSGVTGAVTFLYQACLAAPNAASCATAQATLNVSNGTLLAGDDTLAGIAPGGTSAASVLANDSLNGVSPPAPGDVVLSLVGAPAAFTLNPNGTITAGSGAMSGPTTLTYQICEAVAPGNCANASVTVVVNPAPQDDAAAVQVGQSLSASVASNDNMPAGSSWSLPGTPPAGFSFNADGSYTFAPPAGTSGPVVVAYQVCLPAPNANLCGTATLTLNINNGALVAADDTLSGVVAGSTSSTSVLANDSLNGVSPPADATVVLSLVGAPAGYAITPQGTISVPSSAVSGPVTLTYQICEAAAANNCDTASVTVVVRPSPQPDAFAVQVGQTLSDSVAGNDNVPPGAQYSVQGTAPDGLVMTATGAFTYTPPAGRLGVVTFDYQVCLPAPNAAVCGVTTATLTINNGTLVAGDDSFSNIAPGSTVGTSVLANDSLNGVSPPAAGTVTLALVGAPAGFSISADGLVTVGTGVQSGPTTLTYRICEAASPANCDTASVLVVVSPAPQPDAFAVQAGQTLANNVAGNDNMPVGSTWSVQGTAPAGLTFDANGSFTYAPPAGTAGPITVTYQACLPAPNAALCGTTTFTLNINNGDLVAGDDVITGVVAGGTSAASVLANDRLNGASPAPAADVRLSLVGAPAGFTLNPDGTISVGSGVLAGSTTLRYQLCEAAAANNCDTASVTVVVSPTPQADAFSVQAGQQLVNNVAGNDNMPAGSTWSLQGTAPAGLVFNADGSFSYTPPAGTLGAVTFSYQACLPAPNGSVCGTATVTLNVNTGTLLAGDDSFSNIAPGTATPSVLGNDSLNGVTPPPAASVSLSLVGAPTGFGINPDGTISVGSGVVSGSTTLTYQICEVAASSNCATASVNVVVSPAPQADAFSVQAGQSVNNNVAGNDNMPAGSTWSVQGTAPAGLVFNSDGSFSYTPPSGTTGPVSFTYQACLPAPDAALCGTATVTLNVNSGTLVAGNDSFTGIAPGTATPSVLANDSLNGVSPPAAGSVTVSLVGAPAGFSIAADGTINVGTGVTAGTTTLTYQVCEAAASSNCATATVTVVVSPTPQPDAFSVQAGQVLSNTVAGNDSMPAGSSFSVQGATPAGLVFNTDGSFTYAPPAGTTGVVDFTYQACLPAPNAALCNTATVSFNIGTGTLLAANDSFSGIAPGGITSSVLANDSLNGVSPPAAGTVTLGLVGAPAGFAINADGTISIGGGVTSGATTLTYRVCEAAAPSNCATATVNVVVSPVPQADAFSVQAGQTVSNTVAGNDNLPAGSTWSLQGTAPAGLVFNADGSFTYQPPVGTTGAVTFTYQACLPAPDAALCGTATVTLNVNTGTLVAGDDSFTGIAPGGTTPSVLGNDSLNGVTPPPANTVTLGLVGAPAGISINPDGTISIGSGVPSGPTSITYQVCEVAAPSNCANATVSVVVSPAPQPDAYSVRAGQVLSNTVAGNDNMPAGSTWSVQGATPPGLVFNADGSFTYTPPAGTLGAVTFTYQVCLPAPNAAQCGTASVTLNVNTGTLVAGDDSFSGIAPGGTTPSVLANDSLNGTSPPAAGTVTLTLVGAPAGFGINPDGTISIGTGVTSGPTTVTYQVCEVAAPGNCATASVTVVVSPAPQPDAFSVQAGQTLANSVASNDNMPAGSVWSVQGAAPAGLLFNADGSFTYTPPVGTSGPVSFTYQVCLPAPNAALCSTATVTFNVGGAANVVLAVSDDFSSTPVDPSVGGTIARSVLDNDSFNNVSPPPVGSVVASLTGSTPGYTMNNQGQIMVAPGVQAGQVQLAYQLCENGVPTNCTTAIATVLVQGPVGALLAVDDTGGPVGPEGRTRLLNVFANDTFNSAVLDPAQVNFVPVATNALTFSADGWVDVAAGLAPGSYSTTYTLCLVNQPTVCDVGTVTVTVIAAEPGVVAEDDQVNLPQDGVVEIDVLGNDRMDGTPVDPSAVTVTITSPPPYGDATVLPDRRIRFAVRAYFSGVQTFEYQVCDATDPSMCATASVTITVDANVLTLVDDAVTAETSGPLLINVLANDTTRSAPLDPASLQVAAAPAHGTVQCANGVCTYTPAADFSGTDSFRYRVCDLSVPTPLCAEANVAVTVAGQQAVLRLTKVAAKRSAQIGDLVRYTVTIDNVGEVDANGATLLDTLPPGFTFVSGGFAVRDADNDARTSGVQPLRIDGIDVPVGERATVVYYLRVGAGTGTGVHTNRITAIDGQNRSIANVATADVDVSVDPLLDESLIIGSVFDDRNGNGIQDDGERGIPGVRVAAVEGLVMETDAFGRYHLVGIPGGEARGRNFILKVDPSTLPAGARFTTPNPLVRRITPGLPARFDFGVHMPDGALSREGTPAAVVPRPARVELGQALFAPGSATLAADRASVLDKAAQALLARGGGRVLLVATAGEEALAQQRAQAVRGALASRLPADVAAATRIEVHGGDGRVLQQLTIEPPSGPPPAGPNSGEGR
ncbi:Ig-like domain-containing protein [uncultured Stenotrophomonas sp.]|uniref:Ig-like domain-containing protein n=1 Tax=uncultured Stenotrophomonas sp. TaxID=165438 RepID=UPI0025CBD450|nr:Ig-like domain-containing protein [uncultured Stenotrophomonas sp.]